MMPTLRRILPLLGLLALVGLGVGTSRADHAATRIRVGLVLQNTALDDPFQHAAYAGLQRSVRRLGVQGKVVVPSPRNPSIGSSFGYLARQRYALVIGLGFFETGGLDAAAREFPKSRFAIVDASITDLPHHPRNVLGTQFRTEEAGYLAGYLAALEEKRRPGRDVIGSVGGVKIPEVDAYIAGYQAGARKADPGITLLNAYSDTFSVASRCRALALQEIARGAGVVFQVASSCGLGALAAAKEKHVWGIGVDVDESFLGPHILTSVVKEVGVAVYDIVESFLDGRFRTGRDDVFDLRNGGVGLGKISPKVPRSFLRQLDRIRTEIVAGKIRVPTVLAAR